MKAEINCELISSFKKAVVPDIIKHPCTTIANVGKIILFYTLD